MVVPPVKKMEKSNNYTVVKKENDTAEIVKISSLAVVEATTSANVTKKAVTATHTEKSSIDISKAVITNLALNTSTDDTNITARVLSSSESPVVKPSNAVLSSSSSSSLLSSSIPVETQNVLNSCIGDSTKKPVPVPPSMSSSIASSTASIPFLDDGIPATSCNTMDKNKMIKSTSPIDHSAKSHANANVNVNDVVLKIIPDIAQPIPRKRNRVSTTTASIIPPARPPSLLSGTTTTTKPLLLVLPPSKQSLSTSLSGAAMKATMMPPPLHARSLSRRDSRAPNINSTLSLSVDTPVKTGTTNKSQLTTARAGGEFVADNASVVLPKKDSSDDDWGSVSKRRRSMHVSSDTVPCPPCNVITGQNVRSETKAGNGGNDATVPSLPALGGVAVTTKSPLESDIPLVKDVSTGVISGKGVRGSGTKGDTLSVTSSPVGRGSRKRAGRKRKSPTPGNQAL